LVGASLQGESTKKAMPGGPEGGLKAQGRPALQQAALVMRRDWLPETV